MDKITIYRIKNQNGKWLVEYAIDPQSCIRLAVWSSREERGFPIMDMEGARELTDLLRTHHNHNCEIVESEASVIEIQLF